MTRWQRTRLLAVAASLAVALGLVLWRYQRAMAAHWRAVQATADSTIHAQQRVLDSLAAVKRVDTLRLVRWETRYVTLRDTVTLTLTDTTYIRGDTVRILVQAADSTIAACRSVIRDCEAEQTALRTQLAAAQSAMIAVKPRWYIVWGERAALVAAGVRLGKELR